MKTHAIWKRTAACVAAICMVLSMAACGSKDGNSIGSGREVYQEYVIGIMDANYLGQYDKYIEITGSDQEQAQNIYEANTQDFAVAIEEALSIKADVVSISLTERLVQVAKTIYGQVKYKAVDVVRNGDIYTVTVEIEPVDFFGTVKQPFQSAVDSFNNRAKNGEFDEYSDTEYEEAYGEAVTEALEKSVSTVTYGTKITVDVTLDYDKENNLYVISDEQMEALDGKVVNMSR
ncbi:hypothetical protein [Qiania dongpingensis]|uniref:DUF5105 domain-containing protein n=1 Tax=Qiania dongpingensis TaxID=2763669 RepID=A0A7G9G461_9FIRM|nr:hypothetical protein [Qiania dongpingensis]QNM05593.1 hypothetical protein H9Q78_14385 [Qiania dongpingensis]